MSLFLLCWRLPLSGPAPLTGACSEQEPAGYRWSAPAQSLGFAVQAERTSEVASSCPRERFSVTI
jgi:hypothetical protein